MPLPRFALVCLLVTAASPVLAGNLVPGSDHFLEARADAATNSVAFGTREPIVTSSVTETRTGGYPSSETYAREPSRLLETRPGGPAERVATTRPWIRNPAVSHSG